MAWSVYKHGIQRYAPTPTGSAGAKVNGNWTTLADYLDTVALLAAGAVSGHLASLTAAGQPQDSGITATSVSSAVSTVNAATNANTASTIVKRDGSGNFSAGTVTATAFAGFGIVPIGTVTGWLKSLTGTPSLPAGWVEANGQTLSDAASPYNGQVLPDLNGNGDSVHKFLRGNTTSGGYGGADSHTHTASLTLNASLSLALSLSVNSSMSADNNLDGSYSTAISDVSLYDSGSSIYDSGSSVYISDGSNVPPFYEVTWIIRVK